MNGWFNWKALYDLNSAPLLDKEDRIDWNVHAKMYDGMARLERKYTQKQVDIMKLSKNDTVVDIGCGPGRLSIPIAKRVKSVTSVDAYKKMLEKCKENAKKEKIKNIKPLLKDWLDDDAVEIIGRHDIAIASRSVGFADIIKLNNIAKKYAYILCFADGPSLREIQLDFLQGIDGPPKKEKEEKEEENASSRLYGYNVTFNMLYDMGVNPNVVILDDGFEKIYNSKEEAYEDLRFVGKIPKKKEKIYKDNVDRYLRELKNGKYHLIRKTNTFVMWWKTSELVCDK